MHSFVGLKKTYCWIWIAVDRYNIQKIMTDNWKAYQQIITKREAYNVESYNSLLRHYLARFKRKTKCYSKSIDRVKEAILLLFLKKNGERYIFP